MSKEAQLLPSAHRARSHTADYICEVVCREFGLPKDKMLGRSREAWVVWPRQVARYFCRQFTGATLNQIGSFFGCDHGTVVNSVNAVQGYMDSYPKVKSEIEQLSRNIEAGLKQNINSHDTRTKSSDRVYA